MECDCPKPTMVRKDVVVAMLADALRVQDPQTAGDMAKAQFLTDALSDLGMVVVWEW